MSSRAALVTLLLATQASCAAIASAGAGHGLRAGCNDNPAYGGVDLVLGTVAAAGLLASGEVEDSPAWLILPGVLLASGIIGSISAYSCRSANRGEAAKAAPTILYVPADPSPPAETSTTRDATPEEIGHPVPAAGAPGPDLRLDPDYQPTRAPAPAPVEDTRIACRINPLVPCPPDQSCVLVEAESGYCVPDR